MSDLIRREDAIEALYEALHTEFKGTFTDSMSLAIEMGNNIPSAEPKERTAKVVRGRWGLDDECTCGKKLNGDECYCPSCGARLEWK